MGSIDLKTTGRVRRLPLAASTLLGRHRLCTWSADLPELPLYWLELRWMRQRCWAWRALSAREIAPGPDRPIRGAPREWSRVAPGGVLRGPGGLEIALVDGGAPERFAVDVRVDEALSGEALDGLITELNGQPWSIDVETDGRGDGPLEEGQHFVAAGRLVRFHEGHPPAQTRLQRLDLRDPDCELELDCSGSGPELSLSTDRAQVSVQGAHLWALAPYVAARITDQPPGGWMTLSEAHTDWRDRYPGAGARKERIAEDRNRTYRALAPLVANARELFESRRRGRVVSFRVALEPEQLKLL